MINAIGVPVYDDLTKVNDRNEALLKSAYLYNVPIYAYLVSDLTVYFEKGRIPAFFWEKGSYHQCEIDIPKYTEMYCTPRLLKRCFPKETEWLAKNTVWLDDFGLPKLDFQIKMLSSSLSQYAIPTIPITSYAQLISSMRLFPVAFLKPAGGRKAQGAMKLILKDDRCFYSTPHNDLKELTEDAFHEYFSSEGYENRILLLEPCLNILDDDGHAVDFRCLVSLNGEGKWQNVITYARIGGGSVASNISVGGAYGCADDVLEQLIPGRGKEKLSEIEYVAREAAEIVRKASPNNVSLLGLDICVDRPSNQVYVIEANSKPGTKLIGPWPMYLVRAQYFKYVLANGIPE